MRIKSAAILGLGLTDIVFQYSPALSAIAPLRRRIWPYLQGQGNPQHIALTFDDGPDPVFTPLVLRELERLEVRATFFMLGSLAERFPYLVKEVKDCGHEIALHGQWHRNHLLRSRKTIEYDTRRGFETLSTISGQRPTFYRPPYGVITRATLDACSALALRPVLWGSWGRDWRRESTPASILNDLKSRFQGGITLLLHDSDCTSYPGCTNATIGSLEQVVKLARDNHFEIGPLGSHGY